MGKIVAPLTDARIRQAKVRDAAYKLFDGGGLYIEVSKAGSKTWRLKYRHAGKESRVSLGPYPTVTLAVARKRREELRQIQHEHGIAPSAAKKAEPRKQGEAAANTFEAIAREWMQKMAGVRAQSTQGDIRDRLEKNLFPWIGRRPIRDIEAGELLEALRRVEARGATVLAHRLRGHAGAIFRYAIATGRARRDVAADLRGALASRTVRNRSAVTEPRAVGELMRTIHGYQGTNEVRAALKLAPMVFVRPGELRAATWDEFDLDTATWTIPAERMKMRRAHVVPLAVQAIAILRDLFPLTGVGIPAKPYAARYLFPGVRSRERPMSENTINAALRRLGYTSDQMTGHGFRAMASTRLNELGFPPDVIERQLAHDERNKVRAAYNRAEHLQARRKMMQAWADYLDALHAGNTKISAIREKVA